MSALVREDFLPVRWDFMVDENGIVHLVGGWMDVNDEAWSKEEEVFVGGNFHGVPYAAMKAADRGTVAVDEFERGTLL